MQYLPASGSPSSWPAKNRYMAWKCWKAPGKIDDALEATAIRMKSMWALHYLGINVHIYACMYVYLRAICHATKQLSCEIGALAIPVFRQIARSSDVQIARSQATSQAQLISLPKADRTWPEVGLKTWQEQPQLHSETSHFNQTIKILKWGYRVEAIHTTSTENWELRTAAAAAK